MQSYGALLDPIPMDAPDRHQTDDDYYHEPDLTASIEEAALVGGLVAKYFDDFRKLLRERIDDEREAMQIRRQNVGRQACLQTFTLTGPREEIDSTPSGITIHIPNPQAPLIISNL